MLSRELQIGKAAEHLAAADLIIQGYNAFLSDAGLPYDVVVDVDGKLLRVQVKGASRPMQVPKMLGPTYRFGMRCGKRTQKRASASDIDFMAFVALDQKKIAYLPVDRCRRKDGLIKMCFEFKSRSLTYSNRVYSTGKVRVDMGKFIEDYAEFKP